ncbi:MAG: hypothetical protein KVP17_000743 [Porospora cf. gigantea B]|uniref:uncharacterized protein n=1 Tax=Porospora cf. gigantea B TaxID=2853592 RepID=UPI0035718F22|nr:MAG: hypothetical protein KVP17_000743 [Porospora cf. gigantea B]
MGDLPGDHLQVLYFYCGEVQFGQLQGGIEADILRLELIHKGIGNRAAEHRFKAAHRDTTNVVTPADLLINVLLGVDQG